jgi:septum formation protein
MQSRKNPWLKAAQEWRRSSWQLCCRRPHQAFVLESQSMLVLASNSPRRKHLLALGGWKFSVSPAAIDETPFDAEAPQDYVTRLAEGKVRKVARNAPIDALILAADTTVAIPIDSSGQQRTQILGKPGDAQEAEQMLRALRGRVHHVYTGLALLCVADGRMAQDVCSSEVTMRDYSDVEMLDYIASGDPLDKAGAYAVQHVGFHPAEKLDGCYANVMGLPVCHLALLLEKFNLPPETALPHECQQMLGYDCPIYRQVLEGNASSRG